MKILYGTTNKAKVAAMKKATEPLGITLISLNDLKEQGKTLPEVDENGATPLENARIKAEAYYTAFRMPVFSCDSGLYFDELKEEEQPGLHVRRVRGKELTDDEMLTFYGELAARHGGTLTGRYKNAVHFILDEKTSYSSMDLSLSTEPFYLVPEPHARRVEGFPLDSLSKDIQTGEYYYDLKTKDVSTSAVEEGYKKFFSQVLEIVEA